MGFAPVAAVAILFIAGLASFVAYNVHADAADDATRRAAQDALDRASAKTHTELVIDDATYQGGLDRLLLDITNTGSTTIDTQGIEILLDGVIRTDDITWIRQGGQDFRYWAPLEQVEIRMDGVTSSPARVAIFTETGAVVYGVI